MGLDHIKIKKLRGALKLSQEEAARRAGMMTEGGRVGDKARWSRLEHGHQTDIKLSTLKAIAKALEVKPADLLK